MSLLPENLLLRRLMGKAPNACLSYDTKITNDDVPVMLEVWGMRSTRSLPSLPHPLWPIVEALDKVLSMGKNY